MTRTRLERLETEMHGEPRKHRWAPQGSGVLQLSNLELESDSHTLRCARVPCGWTWRPVDEAEPIGCTGTDAAAGSA